MQLKGFDLICCLTCIEKPSGQPPPSYILNLRSLTDYIIRTEVKGQITVYLQMNFYKKLLIFDFRNFLEE